MPADSPVDIVYLWVDGNDLNWRNRRNIAFQNLGGQSSAAMARYSNVEGRYRDNRELFFSLRALAKFFPDHGRVYIVTDAQVPDWLEPSDRLVLVDHRDLIPDASLPTFDSGHIESWIHHIPGLSERYFYFNDDVFFGAPVEVDDWFYPGGMYLTWSDDPVVTDEPMRMDATSLENACRLSIHWLEKQERANDGAATRARDPSYQSTFRTFAHSPRPMYKSMLFELEAAAPELFERVRSTVFRSWDKPTIVSDFVLRWALAHGAAKIRPSRHLYVCTGASNQSEQLLGLVSEFGELDFFCINDTTDDAHGDDPRLQQVQKVLQSLLTQASPFEKQDEQALDDLRSTAELCVS